MTYFIIVEHLLNVYCMYEEGWTPEFRILIFLIAKRGQMQRSQEEPLYSQSNCKKELQNTCNVGSDHASS